LLFLAINKEDRGLLTQEASCTRGIAFRLCAYNERNNEKVIVKIFLL